MNKSELKQRFLSLVDSYKQVIYKVCFMYATDDETISDLYQEVVLNLWTAFPRFRSESKPSTWVYRISMNTCISRLRHNTRRPETVSLTMSMADLFPEESEREQLQELYRLISQLGELERALILLWLDDVTANCWTMSGRSVYSRKTVTSSGNVPTAATSSSARRLPMYVPYATTRRPISR